MMIGPHFSTSYDTINTTAAMVLRRVSSPPNSRSSSSINVGRESGTPSSIPKRDMANYLPRKRMGKSRNCCWWDIRCTICDTRCRLVNTFGTRPKYRLEFGLHKHLAELQVHNERAHNRTRANRLGKLEPTRRETQPQCMAAGCFLCGYGHAMHTLG